MAARFLSLAFMLGSTCLLWGTTCRLVNRRAALIAAAVFGTLGGTWFLGAYATYDALALLVLNFGTWAAVRASQRRGALGVLVLALAGLALGLACAVKYAIALFVPVVVLIVFFAKARERGWGRAVGASLVLVVVFAVTVAAGLHFGGSDYWKGIQFTTLGRAASQASPLTVLKMAYLWTAFIIVLSVIALFASRKEPPAYRWLLRVLALTVYLVPIEQARIDTMVSLDKHVVFGAWFAAIAAGYVLARLSLVDRTQGWMAVVSIPILAFALTESIPQATDMYGRWANLSAFTAAWPGLNAQYPGRYLADTDVYHVLGYYAQGRVGWTQLDSPQNLDPAPSKGMPATQAAIAAHNFSLVIVNTDKASSWAPYDEAIMADMKQSGGYRMVKSADGIEAWASVRQP